MAADKTPQQVIKNLIKYASLKETKEELWIWFKLALSCPTLSESEKDNVIFFYEQIDNLVEAVYQLYEIDYGIK